jgi:hypothetical protein
VPGQPGNDVPAVAVGLPADLPEEGVPELPHQGARSASVWP